MLDMISLKHMIYELCHKKICLRGICEQLRSGSSREIMVFPKPLQKHAYSNILKILPPKYEKFSDKKF